MFLYAYLFALIVGGVLLGTSVLLGGHDGDVDVDADGDFDFDGDLDVDVDADVGGGIDKDLALDSDGDALWFLKSLRFWTFFLAFFGLTGITLDGLDLATQWIAFALAMGVGSAVGMSAAWSIRKLSRDVSGAIPEGSDYVGKTARVVVPIREGSVGKVRVELRGAIVDVLATSDESFSAKEEAIIIEMSDGRARIAHVDD